MVEYLVVGEAFVAHHSGTNLAHSDSVSPSVTVEDKAGRNVLGIHVLPFYFER